MGEYTAGDWPVTHDGTREELESLLATHRIRPIPAWDENGHFIKPDAYRRSLEEAIVEVHFTLAHWAIAGKKSMPGNDAFVGEIDTIHVLVPPRVISRGANRKRKLKLRLEDGPGGSKKKGKSAEKD